MTDALDYDCIIVGAGSAGCVLANRLTADKNRRVLLPESGPLDSSAALKIPAGFTYAMNNKRFDWNYLGEREPYLNDRRLICNRGRVLGGSSSINALCFVRGHRMDVDRWARETGDSTWSYEHCLPYFKKLETYSEGGNEFRGDDGPLNVLRPRFSNPLNDVFARACAEVGFAWSEDSNAEFQEGFGFLDQTIHAGVRQSAAVVYLPPILWRPTLTLICNADVSKLTFDGNRCTGVAYCVGGEPVRVLRSREVVVCAGAIASPALLLRSGVGPGAELQKLDIPVVCNAPEVGKNLQDHVNINLQFECSQPITATVCLRWYRKALLGLQWALFRSGPAVTNHFEIAAYVHSEPALEHPDLQLLFLPLLVDDSGRPPFQSHGYQVAVSNLRSHSHGTVSLASPDFNDHPSIRFNYLETNADRETLFLGIRIARRIVHAKAFDAYRGKELLPGEKIIGDRDLLSFLRECARSTKHACGTYRMGTDEQAVVDTRGRVHGVVGLRVVDASIMPSITSGNINAPTMMLAEKIAQSMCA